MTVNSSSDVQSQPQHKVFINFRGDQLRTGFVSHLERALRRDGINAYIDSQETKGNKIEILFSRIEESRIALAVFSSRYTESKWCLNELDKMNQRVDLKKLVVIPIFYKVKTSDVKKLEGEFGDKFWELIRKGKDVNFDGWTLALKAVSNILGFTLEENSNEADYIVKIVKEVIQRLSTLSRDPEIEIPISTENPIPRSREDEETLAAPAYALDSKRSLYGIKTRLKQLKGKLDLNCERTLKIGIVGMPGIGKTTLTKMLCEDWEHNFLHCVFVDDPSPESLKEILLNKKSLVVLDNVSDKQQIQLLLAECDCLQNGSLILITTSDRSVVEGNVDDTYEVPRLSSTDSFKYFSYFACPPKGNFRNLSIKFADYAKGNPFILKTLGVELKGQGEAHWEVTFSKLAQIPNETIRDVLQISYNGLSQLQKDAFLDVACFFRSGDEYYVKCLVESCDTELKDLASKFLINISGGRVEMHDLFCTFGKELGSDAIVGSARLCDYKDVVPALKKKPLVKQGADKVRGIFLDMSELKKIIPLEKYAFKEMCNLRYLKLYSSRCHRECEADCKLNFPAGLDFPLEELRYLYWLKFPLKKLPKDFIPSNLTDLNLPYSKIEEVWEGVKDTPKLKWADLSYSSKLSNLSGLLNAESLQKLNLEGCTSLTALPSEMERMKSLIYLNMRGCTSLRVLPNMNMISMKTLILTNCSRLQNFHVISDNLETLHLDGTAIAGLPSNIVKLQKLIVMNLKYCKLLRSLPQSLGNLIALQELVLSGCSKLKKFPVPIENMKGLQILLLDGTGIMPTIVEDLRGINGLSSLRRLCLSNNSMISNLQMVISQLHHLRWLDLKYCKNLTTIPWLPPNLEILDAHGCDKLKTVVSPSLMALEKLMEQVRSKFIFTNCNNLEQAAKDSIALYARMKSQLYAHRCYKESNDSEALIITSFPGSEVPSWFDHHTTGSTLNLNFPAHWCDNRLSTIALCAIVSFPSTQEEKNRLSIECTWEFKNKLDECIRFSCIIGGGWIEPRTIDSDHVFIGHTTCSHITNHVEYRNCVSTEASIVFEVKDGVGEIVNCGLSLVYEEPNQLMPLLMGTGMELLQEICPLERVL